MNLEQIISDFEYIEEWEDRYRYVIDLGSQLEPYPEELKTPATKVQGFESYGEVQQWLSLIQGEEITYKTVHKTVRRCRRRCPRSRAWRTTHHRRKR